MEKRAWHFEFPNGWLIIAAMVFITAILSWVVPSGSYEYIVQNVNGVLRRVAVPGSFHYIDKSLAQPTGFFAFFGSFYRGCVAAADIFFVMLFCTGTFGVMVCTGAFQTAIGVLLSRLCKNSNYLAVLLFFFFSACSSAFGMLSEFYGFYPLLCSLGVAMGCDAMFGFALLACGEFLGFMSATTNPYTLAVAQLLSDLPLYSAMGFHLVCYFVFIGTTAFYIVRYGNRVKTDATRSLLYGTQAQKLYDQSQIATLQFDFRSLLVLADMLLTLAVLMFGLMKLAWGYAELCGLFVLMSIVAAAIMRWNANKYCDIFTQSIKQMLWGAMLTGLAKAMMLIMEDAKIVDTITYFLTNLLQNAPSKFSAQLMLIVHTLINFPISSGSGKALITMPIMAPLADNLGLTRQVAVSAFLFGDGLTKLVWPTGGCIIVCALAGIPYERWLRFFLPLCGLLYLEQMALLQIAVVVGL